MKEKFHGDAGDSLIIEAAIRWGDWIVQQKELSTRQREIIGRVQEALRQYPHVVWGLNAEYGFDVSDNRYLEWESSEEGLKHWNNNSFHKPPETVNYGYCVSYSASNDHEKSANIEIFKNIYVTPSRDSIGWDEYENLYERIVPEGESEFSIMVRTQPNSEAVDEQHIEHLLNWKTEVANDFDTKARIKPQGFTLEWDIAQR